VTDDLTDTPDNERRISKAVKSSKKALEAKGEKAWSRSTSFESNNFASNNNSFHTLSSTVGQFFPISCVPVTLFLKRAAPK